MAEFVRWFGKLSKGDTAVAGGKGANLGEMARAGLPVPPGFVLTAAAYNAFIDAAGLQAEIDRQIAQVDVDSSASLDGAAGPRHPFRHRRARAGPGAGPRPDRRDRESEPNRRPVHRARHGPRERAPLGPFRRGAD